MRATVCLAPKLDASMHAVMLRVSWGVTAINRSHLLTPASFIIFIEVGEPTIVIKL